MLPIKFQDNQRYVSGESNKKNKNKNKDFQDGVHGSHLGLPIKTISANFLSTKKVRKVQGVPQSQTAFLPRPQEEEETDKSKQAQTEQTYEKHQD